MKQSLRRVILPTLSQGLGCLGFSLVLMGLLYHDQILQRVRHGSLTNVFGQLNYASQLQTVTQSPIVHTAVIVAFWSGVGLVAYTIVWSIVNVLIEARNEVVLETEYTNKSAFIDRIKTPLAQLMLATALFAGLLLCAKSVFPFWLHLAFTALSSTSNLTLIGDGLGAIFGMAGTIYLLILLGQLVFWLG